MISFGKSCTLRVLVMYDAKTLKNADPFYNQTIFKESFFSPSGHSGQVEKKISVHIVMLFVIISA